MVSVTPIAFARPEKAARLTQNHRFENAHGNRPSALRPPTLRIFARCAARTRRPSMPGAINAVPVAVLKMSGAGSRALSSTGSPTIIHPAQAWRVRKRDPEVGLPLIACAPRPCRNPCQPARVPWKAGSSGAEFACQRRNLRASDAGAATERYSARDASQLNRRKTPDQRLFADSTASRNSRSASRKSCSALTPWPSMS